MEIELRRLLIGRGRAGDTPRRYDGVFAPTGTTSRSNRSPVKETRQFTCRRVCAPPRHATPRTKPTHFPYRFDRPGVSTISPRRLSILVRYTETNDIDRSIDRSIDSKTKKNTRNIYIYIYNRTKGGGGKLAESIQP